MTDEESQRRAPISYRVPKGREEEFDARVAASGLSVNAFITAAVFDQRRPSRNELQTLARLLSEAARINDRLHEISLAGPEIAALHIEVAQRELTEIRAALLESMRRKP